MHNTEWYGCCWKLLIAGLRDTISNNVGVPLNLNGYRGISNTIFVGSKVMFVHNKQCHIRYELVDLAIHPPLDPRNHLPYEFPGSVRCP